METGNGLSTPSEQRSQRPRRRRISGKGPETLWGDRAPLVLVPLDGSAEAKQALPAARLFARLVGASIHVVHATDVPLTPKQLLQAVGLRRDETHDIVIDQVSGPAASAVVRLATEKRAMLIVMTTRGCTAYQGRTLRPVVEEIVLNAPCPVLLIRPELEPRIAEMSDLRRILLPLDGAPSSAAVIGPALNLAAASHAELHILYVATQRERPVETGTLTTPRYVDQPQHEWPAWAKEFMSRFATLLGEWPLSTPTRMALRRGDPAEAILRFADETDSDLIVLSWQGCLEPARAKVVKKVLENAPCPVLLLRTTTTAAQP